MSVPPVPVGVGVGVGDDSSIKVAPTVWFVITISIFNEYDVILTKPPHEGVTLEPLIVMVEIL